MSKPHYLADLVQAPPSVEMQYTRLGQSGLKVSKVILGAMSYGTKKWQKWVIEEEEALPLLKYAYDVGINTWDTVRRFHKRILMTLTKASPIYTQMECLKSSSAKHWRCIRFRDRM
jgi:hypothetical protein